MSEWAKQQACWNRLKSEELQYGDSLEDCLVLIESARTNVRDARSEKALTDGINAQSECVKLGGGYWSKVLEWGRGKKRLTPKDLQIVQICATIPQRLPNDSQALHAMKLLGRLKDEGFVAGGAPDVALTR